LLLKFERKSCYFFFILKSKSFQFFCKATAGQGSGSMKEQAARQQGAALQKGAATEDRQEKKTAQAAASAKYREDGVPQQELERFARFLLPKIQAFYQSEEGQRLFEEWINRRNAEEKTGKCKGS
jgi:hypothetical protein